MPVAHRMVSQRSLSRIGQTPRLLASVLVVLALSIGKAAPSHADLAPLRPAPLLQYLPVGSQCRGQLPCEKSGNYGIHIRVLGALALDDQHVVRNGLLVPSLILSAMEVGECGVAFPLRFYELGLPVPERVRLFCKVSLPKSILPTSGGALFVNVNLATGPFDEAAAPSGARSTTVDFGGVLAGALGSVVHVAAAFWATLGDQLPQLHAGPELRVRTECQHPLRGSGARRSNCPGRASCAARARHAALVGRGPRSHLLRRCKPRKEHGMALRTYWRCHAGDLCGRIESHCPGWSRSL